VSAQDRERFYWERDRRTRDFGVETQRLDAPVRIRVGIDAASSPAGQVLALSLINMACRVHRRVELVLPDRELLVPSLVPARSFSEAGEALARAIDPFVDLAPVRERSVPTLAIGRADGNVWLGADGYIGHLSDHAQVISDHSGSFFGAATSACLGAAALLLLVTGGVVVPRSVSLWGFGELPLERGTDLATGPLDVGEFVVLVGAGAVGSAILYWLQTVGVAGRWVVLDRDDVKLHNTNRSIGMLAVDAGWGDGIPGGPIANKATIGASLIGAEPLMAWYDEWVANSGPRPDLVIPAGGDRNIRGMIGQLGMPLMIQGATSPAWQAQLHRHGPGDSCPSCRFPVRQSLVPACSEGPLPALKGSSAEDSSTDAALPFLSAAAGLLVVAALAQLESGYLEQPVNQHGLVFGSGTQVDWSNAITNCRPHCDGRLSLPIRERLNVGRRWAYLDD
jgi:hypothetical protein